MAEVSIQVQSAELDQLARKFDKLSKAEQKMIFQGSAIGRTLDDSGRKGKRGMDSIMRSAKGAAGAVVGITSATAAMTAVIAGAKREWDDFQRRLDEAGKTQLTLAEARSTALLQKPTDMTTGSIDSMMRRVGTQTGLTQDVLWRNAGSPFSSKGSATAAQLESAMVAAGEIRARTGESVDMGALASNILQVINATGVSGEGAGREALGFVRQFGAASQITDLRRQGQALAPVLVAGREMGVGAEQSAEVLAALTHLGGDVTGESSRTAATHFMSQIMNNQDLTGGFQSRFGQLRKQVQGMSAAEQADFFKNFGGEKRFMGAYRGLLLGSDEASLALRSAQQSIGSPLAGGLSKLHAEFLAAADATSGRDIQSIGQAGQAAVESMQSSTLATPKAIEKMLFGGDGQEGVLQAAGVGALRRRMLKLRMMDDYDSTQDMANEALSILQNEPAMQTKLFPFLNNVPNQGLRGSFLEGQIENPGQDKAVYELYLQLVKISEGIDRMVENTGTPKAVPLNSGQAD